MFYLILQLPWEVTLVYRHPFESQAEAEEFREVMLPSGFKVVPESEVDLTSAYLIPLKPIPLEDKPA